MSGIYVSELGGLASNGFVVGVDSNSVIDQFGCPIQTVYVRSDTKSIYGTTPGGMGNPIRDLSLSITPRKANSLIHLEWMINLESYENSIFLLQVNGVKWDTSRNSFYDGIFAATYDRNQDSTMANFYFQYIVPAYTIQPRTYTPAVRSSYSASSHNISVNRPLGSAGADAYENTISTGVAMEIAQ